MNLTARRVAFLSAAVVIFACVASAHYQFVHFASRTSPWRALPEKYDLNVLPNKTLSYYISDQTGIRVSPNDSYTGLISQIRAAGKVWSDVDTSDLRLAFAGFAAPNTSQSSPSLEIIFDDDIPPGIAAFGGPTVLVSSNGQFVPIVKSVVKIRADLSTRPSFSETFFGTLVHEIGHGLGLQHTFTSSVMSTSETRTTSRSKPLTSDDIAGISLLYPNANFARTTGSISGRVTLSGSGVNLASVVAISPNGAAVSAMTNPDGAYRIDGVPPRSYFVYVHPLPPALPGQTNPGDVIPPFDPDGRPIAPSGPFETIFYPGTNDVSRANPIQVAAGGLVENINFAVRGRSGYVMHSIDTRAYPNDISAVKPPYLSPSIRRPYIIASGSGLISGNAPANGLSINVLGGSSLTARPFESDPTRWARIDFDVRTLSVSADSPRHLIFAHNNDIYVLPAAFFHVEKLPPGILNIIPLTEGTQKLAQITGTNFSEASRVYFDGVAATVRDFDELSGRLTVIPPPAPVNHRASVVVLNPDGQSSLFLQGDTPSTYTYFPDGQSLAAAGVISLNVSPSSLSAGSETMLQIDAPGANFIEGQTTVGFGNADIVAKQVSVVSPTRLLVNVAVSGTAQPAPAHVTIISGLQMITQQFAFQIAPFSRSFWLSSNIVNAATGQPGVTAGAQAVLTVGASPVTLAIVNVGLLLNDRPIPVSSVVNGQITFTVPAGTVAGPVVLRVDAGGERSLPIMMIVDPPPPRILSAAPESEPDGSPLHAGQLVSLTVADLERQGSVVDAAKIAVKLGGIDVKVAQVVQQQENSHKVLVYLPETTPTGDNLPLTLSINSRTSEPLAVSVGE